MNTPTNAADFLAELLEEWALAVDISPIVRDAGAQLSVAADIFAGDSSGDEYLTRRVAFYDAIRDAGGLFVVDLDGTPTITSGDQLRVMGRYVVEPDGTPTITSGAAGVDAAIRAFSAVPLIKTGFPRRSARCGRQFQQ